MADVTSIQQIIDNQTNIRQNIAYLIKNPRSLVQLITENPAAARKQLENITPEEAADLLNMAKVQDKDKRDKDKIKLVTTWPASGEQLNLLCLLLTANKKAKQPAQIDNEVFEGTTSRIFASEPPSQPLQLAILHVSEFNQSHELYQQLNSLILDSLSVQGAIKAITMAKEKEVAYLKRSMVYLNRYAPIVKTFVSKLSALKTMELEGFIRTHGHNFLIDAYANYEDEKAHKEIIIDFYTLWPSLVQDCFRSELVRFELDKIPDMKKSEGSFNQDVHESTESKESIPFLIENPAKACVFSSGDSSRLVKYLKMMNSSQRKVLFENAKKQNVPLLEDVLKSNTANHVCILLGSFLESNDLSDEENIKPVRDQIVSAMAETPQYFIALVERSPGNAVLLLPYFNESQKKRLCREVSERSPVNDRIRTKSVVNELISYLLTKDGNVSTMTALGNVIIELIPQTEESYNSADLVNLVKKEKFLNVLESIVLNLCDEGVASFLKATMDGNRFCAIASDPRYEKIVIRIFKFMESKPDHAVTKAYAGSLKSNPLEWIRVVTHEEIERMRKFHEAAPRLLDNLFSSPYVFMSGKTVNSYIAANTPPIVLADPPTAPPSYDAEPAQADENSAATNVSTDNIDKPVKKLVEGLYGKMPTTASAPIVHVPDDSVIKNSDQDDEQEDLKKQGQSSPVVSESSSTAAPVLAAVASPLMNENTALMTMLTLLMVQGEHTRATLDRMQAVSPDSNEKIAVLEQINQDQKKLIEDQKSKIARLMLIIRQQDKTISELQNMNRELRDMNVGNESSDDSEQSKQGKGISRTF